MTRKIKSVVWSVGLTVALLAAVVWLVSRGYANEFIRVYVQDELSRQLEEPVSIESVTGNPFGHYEVVGVKLGSLAEIDTVSMRYRMRHILRGWAVVDSLVISGLRMNIDAEGEIEEGPAWWASEPPMSFEILHLVISRGDVVISPGDGYVKDISFEGGLSASKMGYRLEVVRYGSIQLEPPLAISNLSGLAVLAGGDLKLSDLVLETPRSRLYLSGDVRQLDAPEVDVTFRADSLSLGELVSLGVTGLPDRLVAIEGTLRGGQEAFVAELSAAMGTSRIEGTIQGQDGLFSWDVQIDLVAFEPVVWTEEIPHPLMFDLKGTATGSADTSGLQTGAFHGHFARLNYGDAHFDSLGMVVDYQQGQIEGRLAGRGAVGRVRAEVQGVLADADFSGNGRVWLDGFDVSHFPDAPDAIGPVSGEIRVVRNEAYQVDARFGRAVIDGEVYSDVVLIGTYDGIRADVAQWSVGLPLNWGSIEGQLRVDLSGDVPQTQGTFHGNLSLEHLLETDLYGQTLNFHGHVDGQGDAVENIVGQVDVEGHIDGFRGGLDSLRMALYFAGADSIAVDGALFGSAGQLAIDGLASLDGPIDLNYQVSLTQPDSLMQVFDVPIGGSVLTVSGTAQGVWPALALSFSGQADSLEIADVPLSGVSIQGHWVLPDSGAIGLRVDRLAWGEHHLADFFLDAVHDGMRTEFLLGSREGARDRIYSWGRVDERGGGFQLVLDSLHVQADQVALFNDGPIQVAYSASNGLQIDRFALAGPAGRIVAQDHPDFRETIEVVLSDMDLRPWTFLLGQSDVDGVLSGELALSGALSDPLIVAEFSLKNALFYGLTATEISGNTSYGQGRVVAELEIHPERGAPIELTGSFPVQEMAGRDDSMYITARSAGFEMATVDTLFQEWGRISGLLVSFDLAVSGTFDHPVMSGALAAKEGSVFLRDLNQTFDPIAGQITVADGRAVISSLALGRANNGATVTGHIDLDGWGASGWELDIQARNFQLIALPELKASYSGKLQFSGSPQASRLSGQVVLQQADIRLLELIETPGDDWNEIAFYRALTMQLRIVADRQVWIRDQDMQVEISGDMDVVKDAQGLRVYGILNSRRGFYTFQGRRLRIAHGEIQFDGREEFDPNLDIRTETEQRLTGEARPVRIFVNVGGTLTYPEVTMSSDPVYSEADILSILVTGRSSQQVGELLGFGGGSGNGGGGGIEDQALSLMLGVAARQLTQRLGDGLNLDLVEVDLGGANISRIRVGKYFGSRFFLSYAQDMASTGREVGVEFEMVRNVTLEARQIEEVLGETQNTRTRSSIGVFWRREW